MTRYFLVSFVFVLFGGYRLGQATRFLPMIVWDHLNPQLSCKCNWLTIPKIDVYDHVDFMCPSLKVAVKLLDGYSRPTSEMNENIFRRKVDPTMDLATLRESLNNGSFCDPGSSEKLYTCTNGEEGKSLSVMFKPDKGNSKLNYINGDRFVFFNNGDNGWESTLNSNKKKCSMVFIVDITWQVKKNHDMSYGKSLGPNDCDKIEGPCMKQPPSPTSTTTTVPSSSISLASTSRPAPTATLPQTSSATGNSSTLPFSPTSINPSSSSNYAVTTTICKSTTSSIDNEVPSIEDTPNAKLRKSVDGVDPDHDFLYGFIAGFSSLATAVGLLLFLYIICRKRKCGRIIGNGITKQPPPKVNAPAGFPASPSLAVNIQEDNQNLGYLESPNHCPANGFSNGANNPGYRVSVISGGSLETGGNNNVLYHNSPGKDSGYSYDGEDGKRNSGAEEKVATVA